MNIETLEQELKVVEDKLKSYSEVLTEINELKKEKKSIKAKIESLKPKFEETNDEYIYSLDDVPSDDKTKIREIIENGVEEHLSYVISDIFYDETIEDEGVDYTGYTLIGSALYKYTVHYDAEWIGDWSMRCNVISHSSAEIREIVEIPSDRFEITYNDNEVGQIFNAKIRIN